jgi:hypothetical protein
MNLRRTIFGFALVLGMTVGSPAVAMQDATPESANAAPPLPAGCTVIAEGLVNPRYLAVGDDNTGLYHRGWHGR